MTTVFISKNYFEQEKCDSADWADSAFQLYRMQSALITIKLIKNLRGPLVAN